MVLCLRVRTVVPLADKVPEDFCIVTFEAGSTDGREIGEFSHRVRERRSLLITTLNRCSHLARSSFIPHSAGIVTRHASHDGVRILE